MPSMRTTTIAGDVVDCGICKGSPASGAGATPIDVVADAAGVTGEEEVLSLSAAMSWPTWDRWEPATLKHELQ